MNQLELTEERDEQMRLRYYDPIKNFPDKIDQLLEALNRVRSIDMNLKCEFFMYLDLYESTDRKRSHVFIQNIIFETLTFT